MNSVQETQLVLLVVLYCINGTYQLVMLYQAILFCMDSCLIVCLQCVSSEVSVNLCDCVFGSLGMCQCVCVHLWHLSVCLMYQRVCVPVYVCTCMHLSMLACGVRMYDNS